MELWQTQGMNTMTRKLTVEEARAEQVVYIVVEGTDYYRLVPANYGIVLDNGAIYRPRAIALVPRHGDDTAELAVANAIAGLLSGTL